MSAAQITAIIGIVSTIIGLITGYVLGMMGRKKMRTIDADALTDKLETYMEWENALYVQRCIDESPTIEAEPVRHGRWIDIPDRPEWDQKQCSLCGDIRCCQGNYCPNCGAIMDGGEEDEDGRV